jgi:acyl carrier protein
MIASEEALEMIAEALNEESEDVRLGVKLDSLDGWDSMGVLMLMAEFDERFDITLEEEQVKQLVLVDDILSLLSEKSMLSA